MTPSALVLGIGNRTRGDDAAGPEVADRVASLHLPGVRVVVADGPLTLVDHLGTYDVVVVVDAVQPGGSPGRLWVHDVGHRPMRRPSATSIGSHGLGVSDAVALARSVGRLPGRTTLVGIEAHSFQLGEPLSTPVHDRLDDAVSAVIDAVATSSS